LQDLRVDGKALWQVIAEKVSHDWNMNGNCMLVVGATYPTEMGQIREVAGDMTFLVPGIGAQGGDIDAVVEAGLNSVGKGLILTASRSIIFADNPGEAAQAIWDQINNAALRVAR
jgi:orotidine-5'-phosphate decarboxylase